MLRKLKYDSISADIRDRLHWLPVKQRIEFKICVLDCSFSSADSTRLQSTSPRCCIRSNARRDTTSVLMRDTIMTFLYVHQFAPDLAVSRFPVRHFETVYRTLWRSVCRWVFLRQDSRHGYLRKHLDSWNCVLLAVNCIVRAPSWWLTTMMECHWKQNYITLHKLDQNVKIYILASGLFYFRFRSRSRRLHETRQWPPLWSAFWDAHR